MSTATTVSQMLHLIFAALWTGSVLFVVGGVLPVARSDAGRRVVERLAWLSRASAAVLLLTGGHLAGTLYTGETLTGTGRGHLVLGMTALWLVLIGLVEAGNARTDAGGVGPGATRLFQAAGGVAALLLVVAGLLAGGAV
jgi:putative copper export protein